MIATWMLYCLLCALGLSVAAALAERALLAGRGPVRLVWVSAVGLSVLVPAAAFRYAPRSSAIDSTLAASRPVTTDAVFDTALAVSPPVSERTPSSSRGSNWRAAMGTLARADKPLGIAWLALSATLALYFFAGIIALAWMRRGWRQRNVLGIPVLVSERTGPAVVGAVSPAIVVPEWALAMETPQLALMLRHEQEHRRAGDGQLLAAAQLALIIMPWNLALWWQTLRLRAAVELDCDARVLQDADARSYGDLLLEVARPRRGPRLLGATAFAERATQLERRIRVLARHRVRASRGARAVAVGIGVAAVTLAWVAPRPPAPIRAPAPRATPLLAAAPMIPPTAATGTTSAEKPTDAKVVSKAIDQRAPDSAKRLAPSAVSQVAVGSDSVRDAATAPRPDTTPPSPAGGRAGGAQGGPPFGQQPGPPNVQQMVDAAFHRLFDGITLTPDQEAKAREMLTALATEQVAQSSIALQAVVSSLNRRASLQAQRDSALRALLTSDADRAAFDVRTAPPQRGMGGRSGGPPPGSLDGGRGGGRGGGRNGGVGGRGTVDGASIPALVDATFHRLFDDITLTPDQEANARDLITKTQQALQAVPLPTPLPVRLATRPNLGVVIMQADSRSALVALLTNDADRATLQSRISIAALPPFPRPPQS